MSYRKPTPDPSITIPLTGGSISITAAGPVALIRAYTEGREQVVLRATIEQLAELVDAAIARRSAMAKDRDRRRARAEAVDRDEPAPSAIASPIARPVRPEVAIAPPAIRPVRAAAPPPAPAPAPPIAIAPPVAVESPSPASGRGPRAGWKKLTPEALDRIRELHGRGLSDKAIADDVGVSSVAIGKRRAAMGLASNFRGSAPLVERAA